MLQVCDVDVEAVKFSPFEELRLVSCGQESLRFWRVKENPHATAHIPGTNVFRALDLTRISRNISIAIC